MVDIADADLPVFPFKVNWKNGISERLEWKTDILTDLVGNEQRRGLRLHPRRDFEVTLTLWDRERAFLDLWLHRMVASEFLFPLWHDSVRSTQEAALGQNNVWVDTEGLEFGIGSYALLRGFTAMSFERVLVAEVHADRIVTTDPLVQTWPKGTRVEPLVRGQMSDQTRTSLVSSMASETQAEFQTTRAQEYDEGVDSADQYLGLPVLTQQPNRSDSLDLRHIWSFSEADNGTGRRYRTSEQDRAMVSQKHSWFLRGRTAKAAFRSLLYRLKGSLSPVWVPTFNEDLTLAQDAANGAVSIYVLETGFAYTGGPSSGREYIMIQTTTGRLYRKVTGTAAAPAGQERLVLNAALPTGLQRQNVRCISWMDTARLENDRIEFNHVNAADGVSTVSSLFKTFRNDRVAPEIISYPIPDAEMDELPCGIEEYATLDVQASIRGGTTMAAGLANGITVSGFSPSDVIYVQQPIGRTFSGWSPWGNPSPVNPGHSGSFNWCWVIPDGTTGLAFKIGDNGIYNGYEAARSAFGVYTLTGYSSYTFCFVDSPMGDNSGGVSLKLSVL